MRDLFSGKRHSDETNAATLRFIQAVNQQHVDRTGSDATLLARLKSYELAAKMQTSIPQVSSFADESAATQEAYGIHDGQTADMGRRCLLGRRLLEQGVRFVQCFPAPDCRQSPRELGCARERQRESHFGSGAD